MSGFFYHIKNPIISYDGFDMNMREFLMFISQLSVLHSGEVDVSIRCFSPSPAAKKVIRDIKLLRISKNTIQPPKSTKIRKTPTYNG